LKPPGNERLKPKCDKLLSTFAFKSKLRRYTEALPVQPPNLPLYDSKRRQGPMKSARHVIGRRLIQEPRVQNACRLMDRARHVIGCRLIQERRVQIAFSD
jgi:hypothetical protein